MCKFVGRVHGRQREHRRRQGVRPPAARRTDDDKDGPSPAPASTRPGGACSSGSSASTMAPPGVSRARHGLVAGPTTAGAALRSRDAAPLRRWRRPANANRSVPSGEAAASAPLPRRRRPGGGQLDSDGSPWRFATPPARRGRDAGTRGPGDGGGCSARPGAPMTSIDSAAVCTRSAMRQLVLARMSSRRAPAARWLASTRWTPRLRPRWATPTRAVRGRGSSAARVAELVGDNHDEASQARLMARPRDKRPDRRRRARRRRSRRFSSASRLRRSPAARCSSRSVSTPTTWGDPPRRRRRPSRPCSRRARTTRRRAGSERRAPRQAVRRARSCRRPWCR